MNRVSRVMISWFSSATLRTRASSSPTTVEYWFGLSANEFCTCAELLSKVLPLRLSTKTKEADTSILPKVAVPCD